MQTFKQVWIPETNWNVIRQDSLGQIIKKPKVKYKEKMTLQSDLK